MANEFYIRKGLAIATMSVATASGSTQSTRYLVLGNDNIVRWATASATGGVSGSNGTSGTSGTRGTSGTSGTSGTRGPSGTSGTSGTTPIQGASFIFDTSNQINTIGTGAVQGYFSYWQETSSSSGTDITTLGFDVSKVNKIQITKGSIASENLKLWDWFKSFNGTGNTANFGNPTPNVPYSYNTNLEKGYLRIRSSSDNTYNIFKVVAKGYYSLGQTPVIPPSTYIETGLNSTIVPKYYLAVWDSEVNNGGAVGNNDIYGILNIYVDYIGTVQASVSPTDNEQCYIDFSTSLANIYNQVIVADPAYSFQINDGQTPANLDAYGLAINNRNSLFLNNLTRNIKGATGSRDTTLIGSGAGITMSFATASTFIGASAGAAHKSGYSNTFVGAYAGIKNVTGHRNTFIGESAGYNNLEDDNIFVGAGAGFRNVSGCGNVFVGIAAGAGATYSHESVFIGVNSGIFADKSEHSVFVGAYSGGNSATSSNTFVGYFSGNSTTFGNENTFVGSDTGVNNTTGKGNTYIGALAGFGTFSGGFGVTGSFNTFVGTRAGLNNRGDNNTFIGAYSGISNTTGAFNMFVGINAGASNSTGSFNTFIGNEAGSQALNSSKVTSIGPRAGYTNRADNNVFIGNDTGLQNTTGDENFFIGTNAGCLNTSGGKNLYLGYLAGAQSGIGNYNAFIGSYAGCRNVSGSYNTFIGYSAGERATFAQNNTFIGQYAGRFTGALAGGDSVCDNLYVGNYSGQGESNSLANVSCANTFLGQLAGQKKQSGNENVFIGYQSGRYNFTGQRNIFIGSLSATGSNGISDSIVIGYAAVPTANNQFVLASTQVPVGTASSGVFSHFLNAKINGIDMKIPLYY